jgi:gas vesicle protein
MLAAFVKDSEYRMKQRIESVSNEVKVISERAHSQIQALTEVVRCNKSESNSNVKSLRNDVTAVQAQIELQSHDVCERTRVTDLRGMTEQQQTKVCS